LDASHEILPCDFFIDQHVMKANTPTKPEHCRRLRTGFTLIELLLVIDIIAILAAMPLPVLSQAKDKAECIRINRNMRQITVDHKLHADDHEGDYVTHGRTGGNPRNWFSGTSPNVFYWPDAFRNEVYLKDIHLFERPSVSFWTYNLAIGMSCPEIGKWLRGTAKEAEVRKPADTFVFADTQAIQNPLESNPDKWIPANNTLEGRRWVWFLFRPPNVGATYNTLPQRPVNRHSDTCNLGFLDGHAEIDRASQIGRQYPL